MNIRPDFIVYEVLQRVGLPPIFYYSQDNLPNLGSMVWVERTNGSGNITIGEWRILNQDYNISLAYGFQCVADVNLKLLGAGHGKALAVKHPNGSERYYPWGPGNVQVDTLLMPTQILIDCGQIQTKNKSQYFHYRDLMWFNPYPTNEVIPRELLLEKIQQRLLAKDE
ncbi:MULTISPECIES: hypothetical protein [unclassified Microcoleus]|uniref:hypothetical protein n=1 Tax=unclassified Microcoleus TaxID=2642155 RepID=UPI002FD2C02F